jgi:hypothetical protein
MLEHTLQLVKLHSGQDLPHYSRIVLEAFSEVEPVFLKKRYKDFFWHCASSVPGWLAQVVLGNAQAESDGSSKLLELWRSVDYNRGVEDKVLFHATDEARHSRLFLKLADTVFPDMFTGGFLSQVRRSLTKIERDRLTKNQNAIDEAELIDHLVQMNMGEIRTRIHMEFLAPVMNAFSPVERRETLHSTLNGLAHDEIVHIGYIAGILEEWCMVGDTKLIADTYTRRLNDFHKFTVNQTEPAVKAFGFGEYPDLLEI